MTNPTHVFNNQASKKEKREVVKSERSPWSIPLGEDLRLIPSNDLPAPTTFHAFAQAEANEIGGRFASENKSVVVGAASPSSPYPAASGPWADAVANVAMNGPSYLADDPGVNPDYFQAPIVGNPHEVQASIEKLRKKEGEK